MESLNEISNVGVDYFTVTAKLGQVEQLYTPAQNIQRALSERYKPKPWRFFGYQGWIISAHPAGHFAYGEANNDLMGAIVQASGNFATNNWCRFVGDASRFTRLDLMVDCTLEFPQVDVAKTCYDWIQQHGPYKRRYSLILNSIAGQTLYVGSRSSTEFGRVYDKTAETTGNGQIGSVWRYEIELKETKAKLAVAQLIAMSDIVADLNRIIVTTVYDWFDKRNVPPIFHRRDGDALQLKLTGQTRNEDVKLLWLKKQVAPTVKRMLADNRREVLDMLGITDYFKLRKR